MKNQIGKIILLLFLDSFQTKLNRSKNSPEGVKCPSSCCAINNRPLAKLEFFERNPLSWSLSGFKRSS